MATPATGVTGNPVGRPSSYPILADTIIEAMQLGMSRTQAAMAAGVDDLTVARWEQQYEEFRTAVRSAREQGVLSRLRSIKAAGDEPQRWQAHAWLLERTYPDRYALVNRVQVDAKVVIADVQHWAAVLGIAIDDSILAECVEEAKLLADGKG